MEELVDDIQKVVDGHSGADVITALITVLKLALECAPTEETRLNVIEDMVKFLKEVDYATQ